jgi:hypothetical protein
MGDDSDVLAELPSRKDVDIEGMQEMTKSKTT